MSHAVVTETVPLLFGADEVARIGGTRVTLDTVLAAFDEGSTAEEIVLEYPVLALADVYAVLGYCLHHPTEIEAYLEGRRRREVEVRKENERRFPPSGVRERLLARRAVNQLR